MHAKLGSTFPKSSRPIKVFINSQINIECKNEKQQKKINSIHLTWQFSKLDTHTAKEKKRDRANERGSDEKCEHEHEHEHQQ